MTASAETQLAILKTEIENLKNLFIAKNKDDKENQKLNSEDHNNIMEKVEEISGRFVTKEEFLTFKATKWRDLVLTGGIMTIITFLITFFLTQTAGGQ